MQRPYRQYKTDELREEAEDSRGDPRVLADILYEMSFRQERFVGDIRRKVIERLADAIEELPADSFARPTTDAPDGDGSLDDVERNDDSLLYALGYRSGRSGHKRQKRHRILDKAYQKENIDDRFDPEWGGGGSMVRLYKMAYHMAEMIKRWKLRATGDYSVAIGHVERDLRYLKKKYYDGVYDGGSRTFGWPTTDAPDGDGSLGDVEWHDDSLLSALGYKTGKQGLSVQERFKILDEAYHTDNIDDRFKSEWGGGESMERLRKMANHMAALVRSWKRRTIGDYSVAIRHVESDLSYLKRKYYDGVYDSGKRVSDWPQTNVPS